MPTLSINGKTFDCELIIFDMDGTLVDVRHRLESMAKIRAETMRKIVGDYTTELWAKASGIDLQSYKVDLKGALAGAPRREDLLVAATVIAIKGESWSEARRIAEQIYTEADEILASTYKAALLPGVDQALRRMRGAGAKLAIATNAPHVSAKGLMESVNLHGAFETIIGSDDVVNPKPAPDMILLACERCGCSIDKAVYIGDMPVDIEAGRAAGVAAMIAVKSEFLANSEIGYDALIESYEELTCFNT